MGANASLPDQTQTDGGSVLRNQRHSNEERGRKRFSKLSTLKRRLTRVKSGFKNHDHGKMLRELTQTWTTQEICDLVDEYEMLSQLRERIMLASHIRPSTSSLTKDLLHLFRRGCCTDITLVYCDTYFPVHRAILGARCSYFKELLSQYTLEQNPVISIDIKTEGMTKEIFASLLCYLYTGDFMPKQSGLESLDLLMHLGDEFGTPNVLELDFKTLLNSGDCADVVLIFPGQKHPDSACEGDLFLPGTSLEILAHKSLLSARSPYFRSLFQEGTRLSHAETTPKMTRLVIDESVIPRQYARVMLQCMYTDSIDLSSVVKWGSHERKDGGTEAHKLLTAVEVAMEVFEVARFVDFPMLAQGCEDIITEELSAKTLCSVLEWSSQPHGSNWVYKQAMQFFQEEFISIAQSDAFPSLPKKYLVEILKSNFLQACEQDILLAVIKWGEARATKKMSEQDPGLDSKKSTKRREIDHKALKKALEGVIDHVRVGHVLPPHSDVLESAFARCLVDRGMPLDIGEGSFYPNFPWMRRRHDKDFVRPRLFLPYFEEAKAILNEQRIADTELMHQRMSRVCHNMPDTLYMVSPPHNKKVPAASSTMLTAGTGSSSPGLEPSLPPAFSEGRRAGERRQSLATGDVLPGAITGSHRKAELEQCLPDVAVEVLRHQQTMEDACAKAANPSAGHGADQGDARVPEPERVISPVPDVALPSPPGTLNPRPASSDPAGHLLFFEDADDLAEDDTSSNDSS